MSTPCRIRLRSPLRGRLASLISRNSVRRLVLEAFDDHVVTDLDGRRRHCRVHERGTASLSVRAADRRKGLRSRARTSCRGRTARSRKVGNRHRRGRGRGTQKWTCRTGSMGRSHSTARGRVIARPLGIDQPEVLVGPFGGTPLDQPLASRRVDRIGVDGGDVPEPAVPVDRQGDPPLCQEVERDALVAPQKIEDAPPNVS